ncbi:MAG: hypothetical protein KH059_09355 [Haemophilus parainfluenzae]|nr:hypothetical protein [Haemophilus parainfluenzae]
MHLSGSLGKFCFRHLPCHCLRLLLARDISVEKAVEKVERAYAKLDVKL